MARAELRLPVLTSLPGLNSIPPDHVHQHLRTGPFPEIRFLQMRSYRIRRASKSGDWCPYQEEEICTPCSSVQITWAQLMGWQIQGIPFLVFYSGTRGPEHHCLHSAGNIQQQVCKDSGGMNAFMGLTWKMHQSFPAGA